MYTVLTGRVAASTAIPLAAEATTLREANLLRAKRPSSSWSSKCKRKERKYAEISNASCCSFEEIRTRQSETLSFPF